MTRTRKCPECGRRFSYEVGLGTDRKYCVSACREKAKVAFAKKRKASYPECSVEGCENKAVRVGAGLCETHYYRVRRTGCLDKPTPKYRYQYAGRPYITLKWPDHPLANGVGNIDEHRAVLYDAIGPGPHTCYWCGVEIQWPEAVADHLNENKADNRIENLVLTCNECNRARGTALRFLKRVKVERFEQHIDLSCEYYAKQPHEIPKEKHSRRPA